MRIVCPIDRNGQSEAFSPPPATGVHDLDQLTPNLTIRPRHSTMLNGRARAAETTGYRSGEGPIEAAMRITFLPHYTDLYGANLSLLNPIDGLRRYGHPPAVICPDRGDLPDAL